MTCKARLFLWYLCIGACAVVSALLCNWCGWLGWVIPLVIFFLLIAFGVLIYPVPKAGGKIDKSSPGRGLEALVIIVPVIGIIVNLLVHDDNAIGGFFGVINLWAFRFVIVCLIVLVLMHLREEIRMAAKIDKDMQSNTNRN